MCLSFQKFQLHKSPKNVLEPSNDHVLLDFDDFDDIDNLDNFDNFDDFDHHLLMSDDFVTLMTLMTLMTLLTFGSLRNISLFKVIRVVIYKSASHAAAGMFWKYNDDFYSAAYTYLIQLIDIEVVGTYPTAARQDSQRSIVVHKKL